MACSKVFQRPLRVIGRKGREVVRLFCLVSSNSKSNALRAAQDQANDAQLENMKQRIELAAAYREFDRMNLNEAIDNHLSVMAPAADGSGKQVMLIHPFGLHWSEITASSLVAVDENGNIVEGDGKPCYTTGPIHLMVHKLVPEAKCLMHLHPTHVTALACLKNPTIKLLHANSALIFDAITYDNNYSGFAECDEEGARLAQFFGPKKRILIMGNHGALVAGVDVATAFFDMYYLERSCQFQLLAMSMGKELNELQYSDFDGGSGDYVERFRTPELTSKLFDSVKRRLARDCPEFMD